MFITHGLSLNDKFSTFQEPFWIAQSILILICWSLLGNNHIFISFRIIQQLATIQYLACMLHDLIQIISTLNILCILYLNSIFRSPIKYRLNISKLHICFHQFANYSHYCDYIDKHTFCLIYRDLFHDIIYVTILKSLEQAF